MFIGVTGLHSLITSAPLCVYTKGLPLTVYICACCQNNDRDFGRHICCHIDECPCENIICMPESQVLAPTMYF